MDEPANPTIVPVIEETIDADVRDVKTGAVRVRKTVEHTLRNIEMPIVRDATRVTRIPVNRPIDSIPEVREEGDTLIVPVVEEEVIVQKRLVLKEEIHIQRHRIHERAVRQVDVGREHAQIERTDADGNVIKRVDLDQPTETRKREKEVLSKRHKSIVR